MSAIPISLPCRPVNTPSPAVATVPAAAVDEEEEEGALSSPLLLFFDAAFPVDAERAALTPVPNKKTPHIYIYI